MKIKIFFLGVIVLLAFFLRFYQLGSNPPALTWDEAAWGYNAYSIETSGKDEFGKLPITYLESFGDFKPPVYAYLAVLPVKLFGLNEFSTRFPSAFLGTLTVLLTYFLTKELFKDKIKEKKLDVLALIASLILAISPWHILLSRAAFEANVSTFFITLGVYLFLRWKRSYGIFLFLSFLSFIISMNTFNTARIVSPLLAVALMMSSYKDLWIHKISVIISCLIAFIIFLPLLLFLKTPQAQLRFQEVNIFSDPSVVVRANQEIANDHNAIWSKAIHNRRLEYGVEFMRHYFDNLSPDFLFIKGDGNPKFSIQDVGELYLWEIPFLVMGILFLFKRREGNWWLIPYWLIIGIIPAATARETPHALRIEATLPTFQILSAYGVYYSLSKIKGVWFNLSLQKIVIASLLIFGVFNFLYFFHNYFYSYPREFSGEWQYGYKDAISYISSVEQNYDKVVFSQALGRPYIYFLFYKQYDPQKFRSTAAIRREALGFVHVDSFDKYSFPDKIDTSNNNGERILYVDVPGMIPKDAQILKTFYLLNGKPSLVAYTE